MRVSVNAHLSFGMVNVPVGVSPSTSRQTDVSFKTLHLACLAPIKQDKFCSSCGKEHLSPEELCKGFEVVKGEYVTFMDSELLALMPERSPLIKVQSFVTGDYTEIGDLVQNSYWLVPNETFMAPYAVIMDAMGDTGSYGVGTCCLWGKDHLCAVTQTGEAMQLHMLINPSDLVEPDFVVPEPNKEAVEMAATLIRQMASKPVKLEELAPKQDELKRIIQDKMAGKSPAPVLDPGTTTTVDLMAALKASIEKPKKGKRVAA